jgi:preprotein translocase subunit SecG
MTTVLLVVHIMVALALVGTVLLQRSEGGALGIGGGGGGGGGFLSGRGAANMLTRTTAVLAAAFFATSISLTLIATNRGPGTSIIEGVTPGAPSGGGQTETPGLPRLPSLPPSPQTPSAPQAPISQ